MFREKDIGSASIAAAWLFPLDRFWHNTAKKPSFFLLLLLLLSQLSEPFAASICLCRFSSLFLGNNKLSPVVSETVFSLSAEPFCGGPMPRKPVSLSSFVVNQKVCFFFLPLGYVLNVDVVGREREKVALATRQLQICFLLYRKQKIKDPVAATKQLVTHNSTIYVCVLPLRHCVYRHCTLSRPRNEYNKKNTKNKRKEFKRKLCEGRRGRVSVIELSTNNKNRRKRGGRAHKSLKTRLE